MRKEGTGRRGSEVGAETNIAMTISVAEKANAFSVGNNRTCSDRGSGKNECKRIRTEYRNSS